MQKNNRFEMFVARFSWFLAVATFIVATFSSTFAQAQQAEPNAPATRDASVTLVERQTFARVYVGILEGVAPEALEPCVRLGKFCPTVQTLEESVTPRSQTLRTLRRLRTTIGDAVLSPGAVALRLHEAHALSARCLLDTTIGSEIERHWETVPLRPSRMRDHPWDIRRWFNNHRCRGYKLTVRAGVEIPYTVHIREAERRVRDFVALPSPSDAPTDPVVINDAVRALLTHLPPDGNSLSAAVLLPLVRKLVELIHAKPIPVATQTEIVYRVPAGYVPVSYLETVKRYAGIICGVTVSLAFIVIALLLVHHRRGIEDLVEKWVKRFEDAGADALRSLEQAKTAEFARGRAEGVSATQAELEPTINYLLSAMRSVSPRAHPGTLSERVAEVFAEWNEHLATVENRGRKKAEEAFAAREAEIRAEERRAAVATLRDTLSALAARLSLSLSPIPDGEVPAVATAIETLVTSLEQKRNEDAAAPKATTLPVAAYGTDPEEATEEVLVKIHADVTAIFARFGVVKLATRTVGSGVANLVEMILQAVTRMQNAHSEHVKLLMAPDRTTRGFGEEASVFVLKLETQRDLARLIMEAIDFAPKGAHEPTGASPDIIKSIPPALHALLAHKESLVAREVKPVQLLLDAADEIRWMISKLRSEPHTDADNLRRPDGLVHAHYDLGGAERVFWSHLVLLAQEVHLATTQRVDWNKPPEEVRGLVDDVLSALSSSSPPPADEHDYRARAARARQAFTNSLTVFSHAPAN